ASRTGADDCNSLAGRWRDWWQRPTAVVALVVGDERLQPADGDRDRLLADHAMSLAQRFLRTETAAHVGRRVRRPEDVSRPLDIPVLQLEKRPGDIIVQRARDLARCRRALNAPIRLNLRRLEVVPFVHLEPVMNPLFGLLLWRRLMRHLQTRLAVDALYAFRVRHRHSTSIVGRTRRAV